MGRLLRRKALLAAMGAGLLVEMFVPLVAYGPIAPINRGWQVSPPSGRSRASGSFEQLSLDDERKTDVVVLKNGDSLSGEVLEIGEDIVYFAAEMVEGDIQVPFPSLKRVLFKEGPEGDNPAIGQIALVQGGRFAAIIERTHGEKLFFRTISSENSAEIVVGLDKVASMALGGQPLVLLNAEFTDEASSPFEANEGEWVVYKDQLLQSDPSQSRARAYARVKQRGRMRYSWTIHRTDWGSAGVYILASDRNPGNAGDGYRIHLEHGRLSLYKAAEHGENMGFYCQVASGMPKARFEVEYDCGTGKMWIWLNGRQVAHLSDTESPIRSGEYVVLLAVGRAAFDDVRVEQLGGDVELTEEEEQSGKDMVILNNGDRIVGSVKEISEGKLVVTAALAGGELVVDRAKVLRMVFGGRASARAKGPGIVFWDGNCLEGRFRSLRDDVLVIENEAVGKLRFDAARVKSIIFEN